MRWSTKNVAGGFAAGLIVMFCAGSMLGLKQPSGIDPRLDALLNQCRDAEDQLAASRTQVEFWQQEMIKQDAEVLRLEVDPQASGSVPFFCDRAKGLSNRAANSFLDARLLEAMCLRKSEAIKASLGVR